MKLQNLAVYAFYGAATASSVSFEEWLQPGCPGRAFLTAKATRGYCVNLGEYPGKSIRLSENIACSQGQAGWVEVSSKECAAFQVDGEYRADGRCQDVGFEPLAIRTSCR